MVGFLTQRFIVMTVNHLPSYSVLTMLFSLSRCPHGRPHVLCEGHTSLASHHQMCKFPFVTPPTTPSVLVHHSYLNGRAAPLSHRGCVCVRNPTQSPYPCSPVYNHSFPTAPLQYVNVIKGPKL